MHVSCHAMEYPRVKLYDALFKFYFSCLTYKIQIGKNKDYQNEQNNPQIVQLIECISLYMQLTISSE